MLKCGQTQPFFNENFVPNIAQILFQIIVSLNWWEFLPWIESGPSIELRGNLGSQCSHGLKMEKYVEIFWALNIIRDDKLFR
jgi:hypothetical protein